MYGYYISATFAVGARLRKYICDYVGCGYHTGTGTKHFTLGVYTGTGDKSDNVSNTGTGILISNVALPCWLSHRAVWSMFSLSPSLSPSPI